MGAISKNVLIILGLALFAQGRPQQDSPIKPPKKYYSRDKYHPMPDLGDDGQVIIDDRWTHLDSEEINAAYWNTLAQQKVREQVFRTPNLNRAKNVIFFLGDGMSIPTLAASRAYMGQLDKRTGEELQLEFDKFPHTGLSKTYCVDRQVADSACSATAYLCGVKGNYGTIGVTGQVRYNACPAGHHPFNQVDSIAAWAQKAGKGTGVVTTARVTHASPAGTYAHVANREYECDNDVAQYGHTSSCQDIASQLINNSTGSQFKVILGGGRTKFLPNTAQDEDGNVGERLDGVNLIERWKSLKQNNGQYVFDRQGLLRVNYDKTNHLLGLFDPSHLQYHLDKVDDKQPSLAEMTEAAIKMLKKEPKGYFIFIEGGRIDHAHHETKARKALDETVEFSKAIKRAVDLTSRDDTLIVVTSDHAHVMSVAGYSLRGTDILGLNTEVSPIDSLPYSTISYANGPGFLPEVNATRVDLRRRDLTNPDFEFPSLVPLPAETHGGDDVGIFALGPWSHLFSGVIEQNVIPHIVAYAACIGDGYTLCSKDSK